MTLPRACGHGKGKGKGKGKVHPCTGTEVLYRPYGPQGEYRYSYSFMTTALEGDEGSAPRPGRYLPPGKTRYPLYRRLGGPQGRSGQVRKISPPPGFDPRTVQPVASRYTDYTTRPISKSSTQQKSPRETTKRPTKNGWCNCVRRDINRHKIKIWKEESKNRAELEKFVKEAPSHTGLQCQLGITRRQLTIKLFHYLRVLNIVSLYTACLCVRAVGRLRASVQSGHYEGYLVKF